MAPGVTKEVAVIGAGPKAAAIAAWAAAWNAMRARHTWGSTLPAAPKILVFEEAARGGAAWVQGIGYSDGTPELCTPADADVTRGAGSDFPSGGPAKATISAAFMKELSAYAPSAVPKSHCEFGDYVDKVLTDAKATGHVDLYFGTRVDSVRPLAPSTSKDWNVDTPGQKYQVNGVVVTGPGPAGDSIRGSKLPPVAARCFDARSYWNDTKTARWSALGTLLLGNPKLEGSPRVVIAGAGGAAASIAVDLCHLFAARLKTYAAHVPYADDEGLNLNITFVAPRAGLFTRGESESEARTLRDPELWQRFSNELRKQAADHLVSGVVFQRVLLELESFLGPGSPVAMDFEPGKAIWVDDGRTDIGLPSEAAPLRVVLHPSRGGLLVQGAHLVISAFGFDAKWFLRNSFLKPEGLAAVVAGVDLADVIDGALGIDLNGVRADASTGGPFVVDALRHLHIPMLAGGSQPPALGSLLDLGSMAARILKRYM